MYNPFFEICRQRLSTGRHLLIAQVNIIDFRLLASFLVWYSDEWRHSQKRTDWKALSYFRPVAKVKMAPIYLF